MTTKRAYSLLNLKPHNKTFDADFATSFLRHATLKCPLRYKVAAQTIINAAK